MSELTPSLESQSVGGSGDTHPVRWTLWNSLVWGLALLTVYFLFGLLFVGGLVTSYGVGMAVFDWPTTFFQNMFLFDVLSASFGVQVEHSHRLYGSVIGMLTMTLVLIQFFTEKRRWLRWLGLAAFGGVLFQGVLGGMRVLLNAWGGEALAAFHGMFAQLFAGLLAALVYCSSRRWLQAGKAESELAGSVRVAAISLAVLVYAQIVVGVIVRHFYTGFWLHVGGAVVVTLLIFWVSAVILLNAELRGQLGIVAGGLLLLVFCQTGLGLASYLLTGVVPAGQAPPPSHTEAIVTAFHLIVGAALFELATVLTLGSYRYLEPVPQREQVLAHGRVLEPIA